MTRRQWSLVLLMILINYLVFSQLFDRIVNREVSFASPTRTPEATFTPTATLDVPVIEFPTATPQGAENELGTPTPTSTLVVYSEEQARAATQTAQAQSNAQQPPTATPRPADTSPRVTANNSAVNLRSGPGTNYPRQGALQRGQSLPIIGRNADSSWWQVATANGTRWIAASVTSASNVSDNIPIGAAPPPPQPPTATPVPAAPAPAPAAPQFQYTIKNIFGQTNEAITQIRGQIKDTGGNPVNGIRVRVRAGSFCTVSYPSGAPGGYPNGNYDILLDNRAKPGDWLVAIVNGPSNFEDTSCNGNLQVLSEEVSVPTNNIEGVVFVEWQKNY